ncbi:MAG: TIM barrel protein [Spirochaetia bacterium]|jgi:2-keto-myo-inositol isomerase
MIEKKRFALNRIACPSLDLEDFFRFTTDLGLSKVEIRNDLPGGAVIDGVPPAKAVELAQRHGIRILSINALQKFNLKAVQAKNQADLEKLLELASALHCTAIVMCPNNDTQDHRDARTRVEETVAALKAFGPSFTKRGIQGWVEPLGFAESSLASIVVAGETIKRSGFDCYRIVYDTFHHYLGPDTEGDIDGAFASLQAGLIHVSGVEASIPREKCRDEHRVLLSPADRMGSREQIARMVTHGYMGDISFEPFSPEVQRMRRSELAAAVKSSIEYLRA